MTTERINRHPVPGRPDLNPPHLWQRPPDATNRGWRYTVAGIREIIEESATDYTIPDDRIPAIRDRMIESIRKAHDFGRRTRAGDALQDVVDEMTVAQTHDDLDMALVELYDWGDEQRVIVG